MKKHLLITAASLLAIVALAYGPTLKIVPAQPQAIWITGTTTDTAANAMNFYVSTAGQTNNMLLASVPIVWGPNQVSATVSNRFQPTWNQSYQFLGEDTNTITGAASPFTPAALYIEPSGPLMISLPQQQAVQLQAAN